MFLTFLESDVPLTKTYVRETDGSITKSAYPNVWQVSSHTYKVPDLAEFERLLHLHSSLGHCLLKGNPTRDLFQESRAGTTDRNAETMWLCLDFDGIPCGKASRAEIDRILTELGLGDVSYILQWSGSQNVTSTDLRCHVFILLSKPMSAPMIKQWLIQKNFETPRLRNCQQLTKTNMSLTWALDVTACQSDKLIYIAPPTLVNMGSSPPLGSMPRIQLVKKDFERVDLHKSSINSITQNKVLTDERVLELRELAGMPKRKMAMRQVGSYEVLAKPDECVATGVRSDRGFVYFNLNGGDSWAYYHPENRPEFIFNFKGEPVYVTKEILPDYWNSLHANSNVRISSTGIQFLAFLDRRTSTYFRGTYDPATDDLQLHRAANETQIRHFCTQFGVMQSDFVPEWDLSFNPKDPVRVDVASQYINTFEPTVYMRNQPVKPVTTCPPNIFKLVSHVVAYDQACTEHLLNWLAFILQYRERAQTAWIFQGTHGTGKGLFYNRILKPLFGARQCTQVRAAQLLEKFNGYMKNQLIIFIDEIETKMFDRDPVGIANLKNFITEPTVEIRDLYSGAVQYPNYCSLIMSSNSSEPLPIPPDDRRHNIAPRQEVPLVISDSELAAIDGELQDFHDFLMTYAVNINQARTSIKNEARDTLIGLSETTIESTARALKEGNIKEFIEQLPTNPPNPMDFKEIQRYISYKATLKSVLERTNPTTGVCAIARDELSTLFGYTSGEMPRSPAKFTKMLGHKQIDIYPIRLNGKIVQGTRIEWQDPASFTTLLQEHFSDTTSPDHSSSLPSP
jgi:hypothetical protein